MFTFDDPGKLLKMKQKKTISALATKSSHLFLMKQHICLIEWHYITTNGFAKRHIRMQPLHTNKTITADGGSAIQYICLFQALENHFEQKLVLGEKYELNVKFCE